MKNIENFKEQEFCKEITKEDLSQICGGQTNLDSALNLIR